jgi:hypothetical protein
MKTFVVLVLTVTALFLWQRNGTQTAANGAKAEAKATLPSSSQPTQTSKVSDGNWAKHSLDRAHEVAAQVQATRRENGQP